MTKLWIIGIGIAVVIIVTCITLAKSAGRAERLSEEMYKKDDEKETKEETLEV